MQLGRSRWWRSAAVTAVLLAVIVGGTALRGGFGGTTATAADGAVTTTAGCGRTPTLTSGEHTIQTRGKNRTYLLDVPRNYDRNHPYRLVFGFHWMGGTQADVATGRTVQRDTWAYYGLKRLANDSAIFVAPQGFGNGWANSGGEDIAFVDDLIQQLEGDLCVDTTQLFSVGFSYGGAMTYALACERATVFRAVAVQSGGGMSGCGNRNQPVAYLGVHGIGDPVLNVGIGRGLRDTFVKNNGCTPQNAPEPAAGSRTHVVTDYAGCSPGHPVEWAAFDEGHIAAPQDGAAGDSGSRTWVPALVWKFFSQFSSASAPAGTSPASTGSAGTPPASTESSVTPPASTTTLAATPPMGWNTWNTFGCNIDENLIRGMADTLVSSGMRDLGYRYVVVDDCWFDPNRDGAGNLQANPTRFPSGMKALGDYLHGKGLKFGIYEVPGTKTCAQTGSYPGSTGSQGHEAQDARQFAAWGVDYLKYDWCSGAGTIQEQVTTFAKMRDALAASGRPIVYSINPNSFHAKTGPQRDWGDVANLWRTTEDITNAWDTGQSNGFPMGIQNIVNVTVPLAPYARPGHFNDPDMLEVGRGGMNETEMRSHFALWAMMTAPLMAGNDLRRADATTLGILMNRQLVEIDQDALGRQATQVSFDGTRRVLAKRLSNGDVAVALFNQGGSATTISTTAAAAGLSGNSFTLRDAWTGAVTGSRGDISATVPGHGTAVYRVSAGSGASQPTPTSAGPTTSAPATSAPTTTAPVTTAPTTGAPATTAPVTTVPRTNAPTTSAPAGTPAPTTVPVSTGSCTATYRTAASWPGGFLGEVTVTAGSSPVNGWTVDLSLAAGRRLVNAWNGTSTANSGALTVRNATYNAAIGAGASQLFGFVAYGDSAGAVTVSGCAAAGSTPPGPPPAPAPSTTVSIPPAASVTSSPTGPVAAPGNRPCDLYAAGGTPCVAAHSTTRALYTAYDGRLYQVRRSSDQATRDIRPLRPGGVADAAAQDAFCANTTCLITVIYDQSGRGNHLTQAPPGGFNGPAPGGFDNLADAGKAPTTVNGLKAYGVRVDPGTGYRNNRTSGVATGDQPEGMYAVFDGTHHNGGCCFDYGNAETNSKDNGNGTMEAIYFGDNGFWGSGSGRGPWIMADLENGLFSGASPKNNPNDPSISYRYLTAIVKGGANRWAIRGGNAQSGGLSTFYDGRRPDVPGYNPMHKEGAILLGIGGDNSNGAAGTFYEGVMTSGYPSDATENAVQAEIVAAGYR